MTEKHNIKLEKISKEAPFRVPENYFENFSVRLSDKISEAEAAKAPVVAHSWLQPRKAAIFAFAGVTMILVIGVILFSLRSKPLSSREMVEAYKYSAIQEITDEQLAQIMSERQSTADTTKQTKEKEAIIDYLSKENIDINAFIDIQ